MTIGNQTVPGHLMQDGSFLSQDGTTMVTPAGVVQHLAIPATGFLQNGAVQTIPGLGEVYGTVNPKDGSFISADGTILQLKDGFVEHGKTLPDNTFLASHVTPDGQTLWGNYGTDHSFLSQDGRMYVTPAGVVQHGITDPAGNFLQNGTTKTLPNGTVLYGYMDGNAFISEDNSTIALQNGTAVTGTLDKNTGIFTAGNGSYYFVGQNGIEPAKPESDGSFQLPDGSIVMTPKAWSADLPALQEAIDYVQKHGDLIASAISGIVAQFDTIDAAWHSPAGTTFWDTGYQAMDAMMNLDTMLVDIIQRMKTSYQNYLQTEETNTKNVSP